MLASRIKISINDRDDTMAPKGDRATKDSWVCSIIAVSFVVPFRDPLGGDFRTCC